MRYLTDGLPLQCNMSYFQCFTVTASSVTHDWKPEQLFCTDVTYEVCSTLCGCCHLLLLCLQVLQLIVMDEDLVGGGKIMGVAQMPLKQVGVGHLLQVTSQQLHCNSAAVPV